MLHPQTKIIRSQGKLVSTSGLEQGWFEVSWLREQQVSPKRTEVLLPGKRAFSLSSAKRAIFQVTCMAGNNVRRGRGAKSLGDPEWRGAGSGGSWGHLHLLFCSKPAAPSAPAASKHYTSPRSCNRGMWIPLFRIFVISDSFDVLPIFFFQQFQQEWGNSKLSIIYTVAIPEEKFTKQKKVLVCTNCFPPNRFQSMRRKKMWSSPSQKLLCEEGYVQQQQSQSSYCPIPGRCVWLGAALPVLPSCIRQASGANSTRMQLSIASQQATTSRKSSDGWAGATLGLF